MSAAAPDATTSARAIVGGLIAHGLTDLVVCPGSRSGPLAYAAFEAARAGVVDLHVRADERVAAFLALGLARASAGRRRLAAVITTSGTATANLHPAVLEADAARVPLIILTADRPTRLQSVRANQTCDQADLFGSAARWSAVIEHAADPGALAREAAWAALGAAPAQHTIASRLPGPVHLNCRFDDPLYPQELETGWATVAAQARALPARPAEDGPEILAMGPRTVVVAGDMAGPRAARLAAAAGWPLLAEPSSGARFGPTTVRFHRVLARGGLGAGVQRAIVFGHPTLHRAVATLLARAETVVVEADGGAWYDVGGAADRVVPAVDVPGRDAGGAAWLGEWLAADQAVARRFTRMLDGSGLTGVKVARAVAETGGTVFLGPSNPVRDFDIAASIDPERRVIAARGLAGIDGCLSQAAGIALGLRAPVRALVGDLTFLHDAGALLIPSGESSPRVQIVVVNDGGGSIFAGLEHGAPERAAAFDRMFAVDHSAGVAEIARAYGAVTARVTTLAQLRGALHEPIRGLSVIEVPVHRESRADFDARLGGPAS